ncbi:MAG: CDP-glycerol glycerophosphotransferase family protein [Eubacteriales bacterium]
MIKNKIKKARKKIKNIVKKIRRILVKILKAIAPIYSRVIRPDEKTILFISFHGRGYSDNPRALHEYMLESESFQEYKFIWAINGYKKKKIVIPRTKVIGYGGPKYLYYLAKSKYWVCNCKLPGYVVKNKNQVYLQTWHGTPLKRLGFDILAGEDTTFYRSEMSFEEMTKTYAQDVAKYNYMIAPNRFCTEVFQSAFQIEKARLIETGYPRNDCLSNWLPEDVDKLKAQYGIPLGKKVILYAPTWRDNSYTKKGYTFELEVDFAKWKEVLGDEYVVIFKPHYLIINKFKMKDYEGFVYGIDANADISNLYIISDILVTDYSSVFFDYAILKRPIYFYMYDLEFYQEELRGFYIDINEDLPGNIFEEENQMLESIKEEHYDYEFLATFNERFNNCEDGKASKRVVDLVFGEM